MVADVETGPGGLITIPLPDGTSITLPVIVQNITYVFVITGGFTNTAGAGSGTAWAANNGFTLGIRAPGQTWSQCMAANANTYSIGGATELTVNVATGTNSNISQATSIVTGNGITGLIFEGR
jgi:hypothetical protein